MKKFETSKIFLFIITFITALIVGLSCWFVIKYNSENTLSFLIPSVFAERGDRSLLLEIEIRK